MSKHSHCDHDHHDHDHDHHHGHHHHHHAPKNYNRIFAVGISLNLIFVVVEAFYGYFSKSLALMADAGHNLSDVAGLVLAWGAFWLATKKPSKKYTYGLRKSSIHSALLNSIILLVAVGIIIWEAMNRLREPTEIQSQTVMIVAGIGIFINALTAFMLFKDRGDDINIKGAYLHMVADALISVGVVISALVINYTSWNFIDPIVSIVISLVIIYGTWDLLKSSIRLSLDAVPEGIDPSSVKKYLESVPGVHEVHDLHIWPLSTTENALTVHLTVEESWIDNQKILTITSDLKEKFKIHHPTIQQELRDDSYHCAFKSEDVL